MLDGCPKAEGMMMMIRSMSPDVLIVDEIGRAEDTQAVLEAVNAGIKLLYHTWTYIWMKFKKRPFIAELLTQNIFERFIELQRSNPVRGAIIVLMQQGCPLHLGESVNPHV